jgi:hypothetical protein
METLLSITRLKLRSVRLLPQFLNTIHKIRIHAEGSGGLLDMYLAIDRRLAFWTLTVWKNQASMQQFVGSGAHMIAMQYLRDWCSEAALKGMAWKSDRTPDLAEASLILSQDAHFSTLNFPNLAHQTKQLPTTAKPLFQLRLALDRARRASR